MDVDVYKHRKGSRVETLTKEVAERKHNDVDVYKTAKEVAERKHTEVDVY